MSRSSTLLLAAFAVVGVASTGRADYVVWAHDCTGTEGWTRVLAAPSLGLAKRSVERLEERSTGNVHYRYTNGPKPPDDPCAMAATSDDTDAGTSDATGSHDAGLLEPEAAAEHEFTLKNPGAKDVVIRLIDRSCPCLAVEVNGVSLSRDGLGGAEDAPPNGFLPPPPPGAAGGGPGPPGAGPRGAGPPGGGPPGAGPPITAPTVASVTVAPRGTATIRLKWTNDAIRGPFEYEAVLGTDDPARERLVYRVRGNVEPWLELLEGTANLGSITDGERANGRFHLVSRRIDALAISKVVSSNPSLTVTVDPLSDEDRTAYEVRAGVTLTIDAAAGLPVGRLVEELTLHTNVPNAALKTVPVRGRVTSPVVTFSKESLPLRDVGADAGMYLKFTTPRAPRVRLGSAPEGIEVEVHEFASNDGHFVIVEARRGETFDPTAENASIELRTALPNPQRLRIALGNGDPFLVPEFDAAVETVPPSPTTPPGAPPGAPPMPPR